jgi:hypothetical protein
MYIGNQPTTAAFTTDYFNGDATTVAFTMTVAPANTSSMLVSISGVIQNPNTYSINATTLTFSAAPPTGTGNISVRYLGIPASGVVTTAYRTVTEFTATASQTTFTPPTYTVGYINVYQNGSLLGSADYTATNGTTVVLAVGATVGDLIVVESFYVSSVLNAIPAVNGAVGSTYLANGAATQIFLDSSSGTGTGALRLPVGTTAQRPAGATGLIRQNSTTGNPEWWDATTSQWLPFSQNAGYTINYLVAAGGGGSGTSTVNYAMGAGGAGGVINSTTTLVSGASYTIIVGAGAAALGAGTSIYGNSGSNSSISTIGAVAIGGGGGGGGTAGGAYSNGLSGGSGGSGQQNGTGGAGTVGQGYAGGTGSASSPGWGTGGGGGAGAAGTNGTASAGGVGGIGTLFTITSTYYGGGGGGAVGSGYPAAAGGLGGGGAGGSGATGTNGTANTGGGGGGTGINNVAGSAGGSGIVIIAYLGSQRGTGGAVTSVGGYTIHTFTSSGTYTA